MGKTKIHPASTHVNERAEAASPGRRDRASDGVCLAVERARWMPFPGARARRPNGRSMIFFLLQDIHEHSLAYARDWGPAPGSRLQLWRYDDLMRATELPRATYIFADLETLPDALRAVAVAAWERLSGAGLELRLLNEPSRALRRIELLTTLHALNINRFRVARPDAVPGDMRFPVFVRHERQHTGPHTALLRDAGELARALRFLRLRGQRLRDLLVVEFCDTSDRQGLFRKYAAFLVGDCVLPRHLFFNRHWMIKPGGPLDRWPMDPQLEKEKLAYLYGNPHEEWIRQIFRHAGLTFGRIDYGMLHDRPQVWEINTNPTVTDLTPRLTKAFEAIDHDGPAGRSVPFAVPVAVRRARARERFAERIDRMQHAVLDWCFGLRVVRPAVHVAKRLLRYP